MHTTITPFTLTFWKGERPPGKPRPRGWQGTSPEYGDIRVLWPAPPHVDERIATQVSGDLIPTVTLETRGIHAELLVLPSLNRSTVRVGDGLVSLSRNRFAMTKRGRSLRMTYLGDHYRLTAIDRKAYTLARTPDADDPGAVLTVRQSGLGKSKKVSVQANGRVLPADLALAVLFSGIDRAVLTRGGAVRAGIARISHFWAETYTP
ncbi:hypothetical protein ACF1G0_06370 [Streptomyces sp. NPDC013953]|uniref:hypothetical protein n=1 Tax=Streptomyces sp. NPDC013953 TaxID=3364868 RepID=UPI0036FF4468